MAVRKSRDVRDPGGPTPAPGISGGVKGTTKSGGGHSSLTPAGPPTLRGTA